MTLTCGDFTRCFAFLLVVAFTPTPVWTADECARQVEEGKDTYFTTKVATGPPVEWEYQHQSTHRKMTVGCPRSGCKHTEYTSGMVITATMATSNSNWEYSLKFKNVSRSGASIEGVWRLMANISLLRSCTLQVFAVPKEVTCQLSPYHHNDTLDALVVTVICRSGLMYPKGTCDFFKQLNNDTQTAITTSPTYSHLKHDISQTPYFITECNQTVQVPDKTGNLKVKVRSHPDIPKINKTIYGVESSWLVVYTGSIINNGRTPSTIVNQTESQGTSQSHQAPEESTPASVEESSSDDVKIYIVIPVVLVIAVVIIIIIIVIVIWRKRRRAKEFSGDRKLEDPHVDYAGPSGYTEIQDDDIRRQRRAKEFSGDRKLEDPHLDYAGPSGYTEIQDDDIKRQRRAAGYSEADKLDDPYLVTVDNSDLYNASKLRDYAGPGGYTEIKDDDIKRQGRATENLEDDPYLVTVDNSDLYNASKLIDKGDYAGPGGYTEIKVEDLKRQDNVRNSSTAVYSEIGDLGDGLSRPVSEQYQTIADTDLSQTSASVATSTTGASQPNHLDTGGDDYQTIADTAVRVQRALPSQPNTKDDAYHTIGDAETALNHRDSKTGEYQTIGDTEATVQPTLPKHLETKGGEYQTIADTEPDAEQSPPSNPKTQTDDYQTIADTQTDAQQSLPSHQDKKAGENQTIADTETDAHQTPPSHQDKKAGENQTIADTETDAQHSLPSHQDKNAGENQTIADTETDAQHSLPSHQDENAGENQTIADTETEAQQSLPSHQDKKAGENQTIADTETDAQQSLPSHQNKKAGENQTIADTETDTSADNDRPNGQAGGVTLIDVKAPIAKRNTPTMVGQTPGADTAGSTEVPSEPTEVGSSVYSLAGAPNEQE